MSSAKPNLPLLSASSPQQKSAPAPRVVDTPVDFVLREHHVRRVAALEDDWREEASQAALAGNPKRAAYIEWWCDRLHASIEQVYAEPFRRAMIGARA